MLLVIISISRDTVGREHIMEGETTDTLSKCQRDSLRDTVSESECRHCQRLYMAPESRLRV